MLEIHAHRELNTLCHDECGFAKRFKHSRMTLSLYSRIFSPPRSFIPIFFPSFRCAPEFHFGSTNIFFWGNFLCIITLTALTTIYMSQSGAHFDSNNETVEGKREKWGARVFAVVRIHIFVRCALIKSETKWNSNIFRVSALYNVWICTGSDFLLPQLGENFPAASKRRNRLYFFALTNNARQIIQCSFTTSAKKKNKVKNYQSKKFDPFPVCKYAIL